MTNEINTGYDMKDTLNWYYQNIEEPIFKGDPILIEDYPIENEDLAQLHGFNVLRTIGLFPKNAVGRSILDKIIWGKPQWFDRSTLGKGVPIQTPYLSQAISPTAIIPGKTNYYLNNDGRLRASIELYRLSGNIADREVRQAVHTEALAHEYAHTIIAPALYGKQKLRLPDGKVVDGEEFVTELGMKAEAHIPISHYAGAYRQKNGEYIVSDGDKYTSISEELAETIAQMVLPFPLHNDYGLSREKNLANRPDVVSGLESFLRAEEVK